MADAKQVPGPAIPAAWFTAGLSPEVGDRLASLALRKRYATGDVLLREGEPTDELGIVVTGRVALRVRVPERGTVTVLTVEPGDIVGWSAVVPPHRSTSTAIAVIPTEVLAFAGEPLRDALEADAELAAAFYPRVLRAVARRLRGTRLQLLDVFTAPGVEPW